jgi:chromosomal replication initiation ATPase DnaA
MNVWDQVLKRLRKAIDAEDFRRWFGATSYASDSGDQIVVWVPTEPVRRHLLTHFPEQIGAALRAIGRTDAHVRFVVTGVSDDEYDEE